VVRFSPSSPTLGLLCESQVCGVWIDLLTKVIKMIIWCSSYVLQHRMSLVLLNLLLKRLATKNSWGCILTWKHILAFIN
jgi:hypothetical protein